MKLRGFTLAELLIALAILGVIATFTIPKILQSQQDQKYNAVTKEVAAMVTVAYHTAKLKGEWIDVNSEFGALTPYMNYVRVDTSLTIDGNPTALTTSCGTAGRMCLVLHNGAVLLYDPVNYCGTSNLDAIWFDVDPDGKVSSSPASTSGPGKAVTFWLYFNGRLSTTGAITNGTIDNGCVPWAPDPSLDPSWLKW